MPGERQPASDPVLERLGWLLRVLSGSVGPEDVARGLSTRVRGRDQVARWLVGADRFAPWRTAPHAVTTVEHPDPGSVTALVDVGGQPWHVELDVDTHQPGAVRRIDVRPLPPDAIPWSEVASRVAAADDVETDLAPASASRLHRALTAHRSRHHVAGLAVGVVQHGAIAHRGLLGLAALDRDQPLTGDDVFEVGSVTKVVTALGILRLVERGELDLDRPVSDYLDRPALRPADRGDRRASVAQLLLHVAGLPRDFPPEVVGPLLAGKGLPDVCAEIALVGKPGGVAAYSNVGYELLGAVLAQVTREPATEFLEREILGAYGMTRSRLQRPPEPSYTTVAGYQVLGDHLAPATARVVPHPCAGGMTSTLEDLLRLVVTLSGGSGPTVLDHWLHQGRAGAATFVPGMALRSGSEGPVLWRGGATAGFTADLHIWPGTGRGVVILASASPPRATHELARELIVGAGST